MFHFRKLAVSVTALLTLGFASPALAQNNSSMSMAPLPGNNTAEVMRHVDRAIAILNEIDHLIDANTERNNRLRAEYQQRAGGGASTAPNP